MAKNAAVVLEDEETTTAPHDGAEILSDAAEQALAIRAPLRRKSLAITINSGNHAGAVFFVEDGRITVGSADDCDCLITDEGVADKHITLEVVRQKYGVKARVIAEHRGVYINGVPLKMGKMQLLNSHDTIALRNVELTVLLDKTSTSQAIYEQSLMPVAQQLWHKTHPLRAALHPQQLMADKRNIGLLFCVALVVVFALVLWSMSRANVVAIAPQQVNITPPISIVPTTPRNMGQAMAFLNQQLMAQQLSDVLTISSDGAMLLVAGSLTPEETARWSQIRALYDANFGNTVELVVTAQLNAPARERLSFKAVYTGPEPFVVSWSGERYGLNSVLPGGYRITGISDANGVVLNNNGRVLVVRP
jgi:Inner membrane component of T3SS, cytoplasmic domain/Inner membrane component of T3SS, periplasmic domain